MILCWLIILFLFAINVAQLIALYLQVRKQQHSGNYATAKSLIAEQLTENINNHRLGM